MASLATIGWQAFPWIRREFQVHQVVQALAKNQLVEAETRLDKLIAEEPLRTGPRLLLVQTLRRQGRITEAEEILQRTIELGLPVETARREFALLSAYQDFPRAEKSLRQLLEANPQDREVRQALSQGLARTRRSR